MLLLGVDGGGSKTAALLADSSGQVLGVGMGGAANYHIAGIEHTFASVKQAVEGALQGRTPDAVGFCMAAADTPYDFSQLRTAFSALAFPCPTVIHNDSIGVFRAGSRYSYGVGVVCGTGFIAGGISKRGTEFRLPALGAVTGDCAGGGYLGERAMGAAFRAWDGRGKQTLLMSAILKAFEAADFEALAELYVCRQISEHHINNLAPLVFEISAQGDEVAHQLIYEQGVELATAAKAVLSWLDLLNEDCDVVLGGGMTYGKGSLLMDTVSTTLQPYAARAVVKRLDVPPVVGAVLLAADHIGAKVAADFAATVRVALPKHHVMGFSTEQGSV